MEAIEGVSEKSGARIWNRHASPISILVLGAILLAAGLGLTGGQPSSPRTAQFGEAELTIKTPATIRNGEFFETDITIVASAPLGDVTIAVSPSLWRDMTINTMIPAPSEEKFEQGQFRFVYGPLDAGESLRVKIDGQINPPLFAGTSGEIGLIDGHRRIGSMPLQIRVLP